MFTLIFSNHTTMRLEEAINQKKPFKSNQHKIAVNLVYTYHWLHQQFDKVYKEINITGQQYNILRILRGQYPNACTVNLLIDRMLDKSSNASRLVDKLVAKTLVKRTVNKSDRRAVDVVITEKGLQFLAETEIKIDALQNKIISLTESESDTLNQLLDKVRG